MRHQMINKIMTIFKKSTNKSFLVLTLALGSVMAPSFASADLSLSVNTPAGTESARLHSNCFEWQVVDRGQATQVNGSDVWNVTLVGDDAWAADCQYKWIVDDVEENFYDNLDGEDNVLPMICAPITGVGQTGPFANRVWLVGDGDRLDTYEDCSGPVPTGQDVTLTVEVSGNPGIVKLTGSVDPWWWDIKSGPEATDNGDGTYSVTLTGMTGSFEYLWVVGDSANVEDLVDADQENLVDNNEAGECALDGLNVGGSVESNDQFANRKWTYGGEDKSGDIFDACQQTGQDIVPASPNPTEPAEDVFSIYSDAYSALSGVDFYPDWNQGTVVTEANGQLTYNGLDYQGIALGDSYDVSGYGYLHVDFYTADSSELGIFVISNASDVVKEEKYVLDVTTKNQWNSVDIPLTSFAGIDLDSVFQLKVDGDGTVVLDNIYFGGTPSTDTDYDDDGCENDVDVAPTNADFCDMTAIAITGHFDGATISPGPTYNYPSTAKDWAGFVNENAEMYPFSIANESQITFTGSAPGADVDVRFMFQNESYPDNSIEVESSVVTVTGSTPTTYTATVPVNTAVFNNFLMYLNTQDTDVVISDVVVEEVPGPSQDVSLVGEPKGQIGEQLTITVEYTTSTGSNVTGLGLNVHYDSSVLTPVSVSDVATPDNVISPPSVNSVNSDSGNLDGVASTDMYMNMAWAVFNGSTWPGNITEDLLTITFDVVNDDSLDGTVIGFSDSSTAAGYELNAPAVTVELASGSWDFDGSGSADALTDGLLLLRYAFGLRGSMLTADATDPSSTLTDADIQASIETAHGSFADIDASGSTDALTDGLLLLRYLFGLRGGMLVADATDPGGSRVEGDAVVDYIGSYMP